MCTCCCTLPGKPSERKACTTSGTPPMAVTASGKGSGSISNSRGDSVGDGLSLRIDSFYRCRAPCRCHFFHSARINDRVPQPTSTGLPCSSLQPALSHCGTLPTNQGQHAGLDIPELAFCDWGQGRKWNTRRRPVNDPSGSGWLATLAATALRADLHAQKTRIHTQHHVEHPSKTR